MQFKSDKNYENSQKRLDTENRTFDTERVQRHKKRKNK